MGQKTVGQAVNVLIGKVYGTKNGWPSRELSHRKVLWDKKAVAEPITVS
ncbi:hypothetical protein [Neobacillus kokaensis]|nr:hypothetical protein [Neobacillus kokaensis]